MTLCPASFSAIVFKTSSTCFLHSSFTVSNSLAHVDFTDSICFFKDSRSISFCSDSDLRTPRTSNCYMLSIRLEVTQYAGVALVKEKVENTEHGFSYSIAFLNFKILSQLIILLHPGILH